MENPIKIQFENFKLKVNERCIIDYYYVHLPGMAEAPMVDCPGMRPCNISACCCNICCNWSAFSGAQRNYIKSDVGSLGIIKVRRDRWWELRRLREGILNYKNKSGV